MASFKEWMQNIVNEKQAWDTANQKGDDTAKQQAAQRASEYYKMLRDSGYTTEADKLQSSGYTSAKQYVDNYLSSNNAVSATPSSQSNTPKANTTSTTLKDSSGRVAFRPYMYEQANKYGWNNGYIDYLTSYDDATGEITFDGKNIGKAPSTVDGVSYWDASTLDSILADSYYGQMGKSSFRPYMYDEGAKYGLSKEYIDSITSYDDATGEVTFGSKNLGKPYATANGASYWDTATLEKVLNDYVNQYYKSGESGKTAFRPYMYEQGKKYGLSKSDIDSVTSYNEKTGEVNFGGKVIGKPVATVDGTSYWDASTLDNILKNYAEGVSGMSGKSAFRPYMYELAKKYDLTESDIDKLTSYNDVTGEVIFGGKNLGKPHATIDGVSYWDPAVLDQAMEDYISRSGTTASNSTLMAQNTQGVKDKVDSLWGLQNNDHNDMNSMYKEQYDKINKTNPFTTEVAKSILGKYSLAGLQARDNAVASGGASNGGNIDSYAAANAMRQQASLINQGQQAVLDAHQQKIDNARQILESLGAYQKDSYTGMQNTIGLQQNEAQRLFENDETAKNNETARLVEQAKVSGYTPTEWTIKNDDVYSYFLNPDGSFKKEMEDKDIQALIDQAKARGDNDTATKLAVVRGRKMLSNWKNFGQYSNQGDVSFMSPQKTAEYDTNLKQITSAENIAKEGNATSLKTAEINAQTETNLAKIGADASITAANINAQNNLDQIKTQGEVDKSILQMQSELAGIYSDTLSEQGIKDASTVMKTLNSVLKEHKHNPDGKDMILDLAVGKYSIKYPEGTSKNYFRHTMIDIIVNSGLTNSDKFVLFKQLGLDEADWKAYDDAKGGSSTTQQ